MIKAGKSIRAHIRAHQQIGASLRCGVGAARLERRVFVRESAGRNVPIDFVGGNMNEALDSKLARYLQHHKGSGNVGVNRSGGFINAAVDMGFGGEVNYRVAPFHRGLDRGGVADVALDEVVARIIRDRIKICQVPGVSELVVVDDRIFLRARSEHGE